MTKKSSRAKPLLETINSPADLRRLKEEDLLPLAQEMRTFLIDSVSRTGGHLAAGLGTVELTIALHYAFNTPDDRLVWDVGHQTYPHKILTGRRERMASLRQTGGISGFPRREESEFDAFGVGHSSTSISAALGMAVAAARTGVERQVVAVIGDGALSGGQAFEALNNAGNMDADLLVILNDNDMSISPNVGAMSNYLARILSGKVYTHIREGSKTVLSTIPPVWELAKRVEEHMKGMVMPGTLFEELGFNYFGPVDGHNLHALIRMLRNLRDLKGPRFLHVVTRKGKGYEPAEGDPCVYHGVTPFDPATGKMEKKPAGTTYTKVFGDWLCDMAARDVRLVGVTPAMREGSGLVAFSQRYPNRYFDVGIAEQHALTFAAGLACDGMKPVVAIYSTFLQRGYDQLIHDICLQNLPVLFAIDRAGLVGADGATHAGSFDYSYLRCLPNMTVMAPADENECRRLLTTGFMLNGPASVRYPRGTGPGIAIDPELESFPVGKAEIRRTGKRIALLAFGSMLAPALETGEAFDATVVNMRFVKPLDEEVVEQMARTHEWLITLEENVIAGGAGSAVNEYLMTAGIMTRVVNLGLPDHFIEHGDHRSQLASCGLDVAGIRRTILRHVKADASVVRETA
ncbi:MAG: 1-deoxy-D-xylulose-5-phosphate synthase [Gammaproteobacteria bacterium]|nr:1-deoxy-D-xylulose-5-phosphate synthase [Gammaproteobacteria bacterium]MDH3370866.1 1-deoxy-D-xylulose-5-phosphate synthase [Gammaproteobacteria bacterium]MDH3405476.1 1-deoxy-D-xylulose-5-phosphate synthase [Gammaproteobacteria bacterium]MDH3561969.1 1-deoxy-D-xylulose-5-phosphate synthase [Gammaproteobacteria bacterium]MDH5487966.1 1-deoxy-D-xylulose-5-phosphate synthase [Gammaproteobacteria bacterium]